jgi:hypothetical protein
MIEASFSGALRTILFVIIGYYVIRFILRLLAPFLLKKMVEKAGNSMGKQFEKQQAQQQANSNFDKKPKSSSEKSKKVGEYIDYEEIE